MLKDVEGDPEWHAFFKERIEKTFSHSDTLTKAETPDAIRSILRMETTEPLRTRKAETRNAVVPRKRQRDFPG